MSLSKHLFPDYRMKSNEEVLSESKSAVNNIQNNFVGSFINRKNILDSTEWQNIAQPSAADFREEELEENALLEQFLEDNIISDEDSNDENDANQTRMIEQDDISSDLVYFQNNLADMITPNHIFQAMTANCGCGKNCLISSFTTNSGATDYTSAHNVILNCRHQLYGLSISDRVQFLKNKILNFRRSLTHPGKLNIDYILQNELEASATVYPVCRQAFCNAYGITLYKLKKISNQIKKGELGEDVREIGKRNKIRVGADFLKTKSLIENGFLKELSDEQIAHIVSSDSCKVTMLRIYLRSYFNGIGDQVPNSCGEIHLDPITKKEVWKEYKEDMIDIYKDSDNILDYTSFIRVWQLAFPHVKIRVYKQVSNVIFSN
jgi:hypothetical protein